MARLLPMQDARMLQVARSEMIAKRVCFIFCMIEPWGFSFLIYLWGGLQEPHAAVEILSFFAKIEVKAISEGNFVLTGTDSHA